MGFSYHILPNKNGWSALKTEGIRPTKVFKDLEEAQIFCKSKGASIIYIHDIGGRIKDRKVSSGEQ